MKNNGPCEQRAPRVDSVEGRGATCDGGHAARTHRGRRLGRASETAAAAASGGGGDGREWRRVAAAAATSGLREARAVIRCVVEAPPPCGGGDDDGGARKARAPRAAPSERAGARRQGRGRSRVARERGAVELKTRHERRAPSPRPILRAVAPRRGGEAALVPRRGQSVPQRRPEHGARRVPRARKSRERRAQLVAHERREELTVARRALMQRC